MLNVKIFTMTGCNKCKRVMQDLTDLVESLKPELPESVIEIINISERPDIAIKYGVITSPTILIGEEILLRGIPTKERLLESITKALSEEV